MWWLHFHAKSVIWCTWSMANTDMCWNGLKPFFYRPFLSILEVQVCHFLSQKGCLWYFRLRNLKNSSKKQWKKSWYITNILEAFFFHFQGSKKGAHEVFLIPQSGSKKHFHTIERCVMTAFSCKASNMKDSMPSDILYLV